jgi:hypothetical protein
MTKDTVAVFEVANPDDPAEVAFAGQRAVLTAMQNIIKDMRQETNSPGLTWSQIDYLIEEFKKKKPEMIHQENVF